MIGSPIARAIRLSPNIEPRRDGKKPDILLLHYTGMASAERALKWLCDPRSNVSCHYLIDEAGMITQMVDEEMRAWHAGVSCWQGETDINSRSIGIEIHNRGHQLGYSDFPDAQIEAVIALAQDIVTRHGIAPERVLAHSDVAPARKIDPGEKFDWKRLHAAGIGHWVEPEYNGIGEEIAEADVVVFLESLERYGYRLPASAGPGAAIGSVVAAFQRHFRPERVDAIVDRSTHATLGKLIAALP